jgi:hypothetical protein
VTSKLDEALRRAGCGEILDLYSGCAVPRGVKGCRTILDAR